MEHHEHLRIIGRRWDQYPQPRTQPAAAPEHAESWSHPDAEDLLSVDATRGPYRRSDDRILDELNERISEDAMVGASEIDCTVRNGEVTLSGTCRDRETRTRAEEIAESVYGVREVTNTIRMLS
jgi:osmotically-inducible protein OsmY